MPDDGPATDDHGAPATALPLQYATPIPRLDDPDRFPQASTPPIKPPDGGGSDPDGGAGAARTPPDATSPFATRLERAPIDGMGLLSRESHPPRYALYVVSGLPSGCARYSHTEVERSGARIAVNVWNIVPASSDVHCTMVYGTHEQTVDLGSDFASGQEYLIDVNGERLRFVAQ